MCPEMSEELESSVYSLLIDKGLCSNVVLQAYKGQTSHHLPGNFCVIIELVYQDKNRSKTTTKSGTRRMKG